jgi:hypothetical protein
MAGMQILSFDPSMLDGVRVLEILVMVFWSFLLFKCRSLANGVWTSGGIWV